MGTLEFSLDEDSAGQDEGRPAANQPALDAERAADAATPSWRAALSARSIEDQVLPI